MDVEKDMQAHWKQYTDTKRSHEALPKAHARYFARCVQLKCAQSADDKEFFEKRVFFASTTLGVLLETIGFGLN